MKQYTKDNSRELLAKARLYRKKQFTFAVKIPGPFSVETLEGTMWCENGWLAWDVEGNVYPIDAVVFEKSYEKVT